jgi:hypothetical protein
MGAVNSEPVLTMRHGVKITIRLAIFVGLYCALILILAVAYGYLIAPFVDYEGWVESVFTLIMLSLCFPSIWLLAGDYSWMVVITTNGLFWGSVFTVIIEWSRIKEERWARRISDVSHCKKCGYDLRGSHAGETCPECGEQIPEYMRRRLAKAAAKEH